MQPKRLLARVLVTTRADGSSEQTHPSEIWVKHTFPFPYTSSSWSEGWKWKISHAFKRVWKSKNTFALFSSFPPFIRKVAWLTKASVFGEAFPFARCSPLNSSVNPVRDVKLSKETFLIHGRQSEVTIWALQLMRMRWRVWQEVTDARGGVSFVFKFLLQPNRKHNITQYGELGFQSLLRWKMIILPLLTTSLIHFSWNSDFRLASANRKRLLESRSSRRGFTASSVDYGGQTKTPHRKRALLHTSLGRKC